MDRTDFIETRTDVIKNIYTLYSYTLSDENERGWALERFMKGKCFIVEPWQHAHVFSQPFQRLQGQHLAKTLRDAWRRNSDQR